MIALTFFHGLPTKTPSIRCPAFISVEIDLNFVCFGCYDLWLGVAAAVVHQSCPVPIGDSDKVGGAGGDSATNKDGKGAEFKPQYLSSVHNDLFYFVDVIGICARMVW